MNGAWLQSSHFILCFLIATLSTSRFALGQAALYHLPSPNGNSLSYTTKPESALVPAQGTNAAAPIAGIAPDPIQPQSEPMIPPPAPIEKSQTVTGQLQIISESLEDLFNSARMADSACGCKASQIISPLILKVNETSNETGSLEGLGASGTGITANADVANAASLSAAGSTHQLIGASVGQAGQQCAELMTFVNQELGKVIPEFQRCLSNLPTNQQAQCVSSVRSYQEERKNGYDERQKSAQSLCHNTFIGGSGTIVSADSVKETAANIRSPSVESPASVGPPSHTLQASTPPPATQKAGMSTLTKVGIGAAAFAAGFVIMKAIDNDDEKKKKSSDSNRASTTEGESQNQSAPSPDEKIVGINPGLSDQAVNSACAAKESCAIVRKSVRDKINNNDLLK